MQLKEDMLFDNRYLLKKLLGCGGFSEVWLVEDTKVGNKKMALKVYAPGTGLDEDGVQLFSSEFELVFDLNHTHLLRPSHFDVCERSPYLLMPFSEQGAATKLVGNMSEDDAWRFLHDVAAGLAYLHAQEPPIIHQDIKPDNILIDYQGHYQITDFGISTKVRSTLRKSVSSAKSAGTMAYMPPERFGKDNIPIKASDIWAMGATLYELISGDMPFSEHGGLVQKSGAEIPNIPGHWSDELREIIARCLQKEPWDRPVAQQVVDWCDHHFKNEKILFDTGKKPNPKAVKTAKKSGSGKTTGWGIAITAAVATLVFFGVKFYLSGDISRLLPTVDEPANTELESAPVEMEEPAGTPPSDWTEEYDRLMQRAETHFRSRKYEEAKTTLDSARILIVRNQDNSGREETVKSRIASCDSALIAQAGVNERERIRRELFIADYERYVSQGRSAFSSQNYTEAKAEYDKALELTVQNRDAARQKTVQTLIDECITAEREVFIEDYNRFVSQAQSAFNSQNYSEAKAVCNRAFDMAVRLQDAERQRNIETLIADCDKAIEEKAIQERLALYNLFNNNRQLGDNYLIGQRKSDNLWGIIDRKGNVVETPGYTQASVRLRNGCYALRNAQGWTVFDTSLNKIATGLEKLDDYQ